jgi:hypothetical protein
VPFNRSSFGTRFDLGVDDHGLHRVVAECCELSSRTPERDAVPRSRERPATVIAVLSYLDAQTGSMIVAAFAGGAAGIAVLLRMYGNRLLGVISKTHRTRAEEAKARLLGDADH